MRLVYISALYIQHFLDNVIKDLLSTFPNWKSERRKKMRERDEWRAEKWERWSLDPPSVASSAAQHTWQSKVKMTALQSDVFLLRDLIRSSEGPAITLGDQILMYMLLLMVFNTVELMVTTSLTLFQNPLKN